VNTRSCNPPAMRDAFAKLRRAQRWLGYSQGLMIALGLPNLLLVAWIWVSRAVGYEPIAATKLGVWLLLVIAAIPFAWYVAKD